MSRGFADIDVYFYVCPHTSGITTQWNIEFRSIQDEAAENVYFYSFFPGTKRLWNSVPEDLVYSSCLEILKSKLQEYLINKYLLSFIHLLFLFTYS